MGFNIEDLEREAAEAEQAATAVKLTDDEARAAAAVARIAKAREERAAADKVRRDLDLATREAAARKALGPKVLVKGVDLVALFPLGVAPPPEQLPGGGVIVVRNPLPGRMAAFHAEVEHKQRSLAAIYTDLLCEHTIDPDAVKDTGAGALLRAFCEAYEGAAIGAGDVVAKLGGARAQADKRGRA